MDTSLKRSEPANSDRTRIEELRSQLTQLGQEHVLRFWERLDSDARGRLADQLGRLLPGMPALLRARRDAVEALEHGRDHKLAPPDVIPLPERGGSEADRAEARSRGEALLEAGRMAAFVVAGGQGTRLGFDGPKGAYPLGPVSDRCLFAIHAQKIAGLRRRTGAEVPWYVMTSPATDAATRALFEHERCFGLDADSVTILTQAMVPAFDFDGRLILETPDHVFESPNGHGGAFTALADSGALDDMERRGVDTLFYFQVDNPLVKIGDPIYLGFHAGVDADMSCKVLRKPDPDVKWGVLARIDERIGIVEYTELDDATRNARDADGELVYWAGSPAIHLLSTRFVRRVAGQAGELLPYHASAKKIPTVDPEGRSDAPAEPNGHKLERFVFDALPAADRVCLVEDRIEQEFSPVKNAEGPESPSTARRDLVAEYRRWLTAAGVPLPPEGQWIEIDHARIDGPDDAIAAGIGSLEAASDFIQVAPGSAS